MLIKRGCWQALVGFLKNVILILIKKQRKGGLPFPELFVGFGKTDTLIPAQEVSGFWSKYA